MSTNDAEYMILQAVERMADEAIADIRDAIRQPSVSHTGEGIRDMADWTERYLKSLGAITRQVEGVRAPIVEGELIVDRSLPTLLVYDLYDVQPAREQAGWSVDPFAAEIVTDLQGRRRIVGRGAFNSKGPLFGTLAVLKAFQRTGIAPPVNFRFLIEGEEEIGSPSLPNYIATNHDRLAACDAAFIPYFGTSGRGETILRLGFKGLSLLEFSVTGGEWGGPARADAHALHGALVASPTWQLTRALATLIDADERLVVDGLAAMTPAPSADDRALVDEAASVYDLSAYRADLGVEHFKGDGTPRDALERLMFSCTLNIDAFAAGTLQDGSDPATLIPRVARAVADLRTLPDMKPDAVIDLIRSHLDRRGFDHVAIKKRSVPYPASRALPGEPVVKALVEACRAHASKVTVFPIHAGAAPMYLFSEVLGVPFAFGGVGHGAGSHGPNEYILLDDVLPFMKSVASFFFRYGAHHAARARHGVDNAGN
jgi:acetylornithine deacetylase/succinyl-diaminopimelate desuccinylase-like protein